MTRHDWSMRVRQRDGNICVICGSSFAQAHHIEDDSNQLDNGVSLCRKCHVLAHRGSYNSVCKGKLSPYDAAIKLVERARSNETDTLIWRMVTADEAKTRQSLDRSSHYMPVYDDGPPWPINDTPPDDTPFICPW